MGKLRIKALKCFMAFSLCFLMVPSYALAEVGNTANQDVVSESSEASGGELDEPSNDVVLPSSEESDGQVLGNQEPNPGEGDGSSDGEGEPDSDVLDEDSDGANAALGEDVDEGASQDANSATNSEDAAERNIAADDACKVDLKQIEGSTKVSVSIPDIDALLADSVADALSVKASMEFDGKVTRSASLELSLSGYDADNAPMIDFGAYGKFDVSVVFSKDGEEIASSEEIFHVIADEYNIAPLGGTLPVTLFSLQLWDITHDADGAEIPTMVLLERPSSYNWENLPDGVYGMPTLTESDIAIGSSDFSVASKLFQNRVAAVQDYIADLHEGNPDAKINLYIADYYVGLIQSLIYANQLPEECYSIHLLSDGSFSARSFNATYASSDPFATHESLLAAWNEAKETALSIGSIPSDYKLGESDSSSRVYAALCAESGRCEWDVARSDLFIAGDRAGGAFTQQARSSVTQLAIASMLSSLQAKGDSVVQQFKSLYNFSDDYFADAQTQGKQVMLLLGTRVTSEQNFVDYAELTKVYYGTDEYAYYYKGHPGTPTDFYPQKQENLENLGITDVDSSIAAELILFFYPDIYLSGYYGSTTYQSVPKDMTSGLWGQTKATALADKSADYSIMDWFASPASNVVDEGVKALLPSGHACYLVEFSDEILSSGEYSFAIWDATDAALRYYLQNADGSYALVGEKTSEGEASTVSIAEGDYIIKSDLATKYVLDAKSAGKSNGTNVQLYASNMTKAQRWHVSYDADGNAIITNANSGKVLDVDKKSRNVQLWTDCGTDNQRWTFSRGEGGSIVISSVYDPSLHIAVSGGSAKSGANVIVSDSVNGIGFEFLAYPANVLPCEQVIDDGYYILAPSAAAHGLGDVVLDIESASAADKANAQLYTSNGTYAQIFHFEYVNGYYRIENASSEKALTAENGNVVAGTNVYQMAYSGADSQLWSVKENKDGSYTFINKASGLVLDVSGGKMTDGANVQVYTANGTAAQMWVLEEAQGPREALDALAAKNKEVLADGTYVIKSALANTQVLDVKSGSKSDKANVQLYRSNMTGAQSWRVQHDGKGYVTFVNTQSGKALDVNAAKRTNGTNVQQYGPNDSYAQKWVVVDSSDGEYEIVSAVWPEMRLDVKSAKTANGINVQIYKTNGTDSQKFSFLPTDPNVAPCEDLGLDGWYTVSSSINRSYVLDVASASKENGANVQLYKGNGTLAQMFKFTYLNGYYQVICAGSGKALDVDNGNVVPTTNVQQWAASSTNENQLFSISENEDGTYTLTNKSSGLVMDVYGGTAANGKNVHGYTSNGTAAQKFDFEKCTNLLAEGIYTISPAVGSGRSLDVKNASTSNGANVQAYSSNATLAQKWQVEQVEGMDNTYTLESLNSGLLLSADSNGNVCQRTGSSSKSQYWVPAISTNGGIILENVGSGKVLDIASASTKSGANVQVYAPNGTNAQKFYFKTSAPLGNGTYLIRTAKNSSKVLDVKSGSTSNKANVQIYSSNDTGAQKWMISRNSDGTYKILNAQSGKALDVASGKKVSGANVQQYTSNGTAAQKWKVVYEGGGQFKIVSALSSSLVLDVKSGSTANGANVQIYEDNGSIAQRFTFKTTTYDPGKVLNVPRQKIVQWLESKENTKYYIGTPFSWTHGISTCMYPKGAPRSDGYVGMNCTGFVAHVYRACGGSLSPIGKVNSYSPWSGGPGGGSYVNAWRWYGYARLNHAEMYEFNSVSAMLKSGKAEKGDLIFFKTNGSIDCHIGFFWGDKPSENKMWHQIYPKNTISKCFNNANKSERNQKCVLIKGID